MIGLLLLELFRFLYFREFLILRANIDEIEKIKKNGSAIRLCLPAVKIWSKSVQPFPRYRGDKNVTDGRTDERTDERTDGRTYVLTHRKLIVGYPLSQL